MRQGSPTPRTARSSRRTSTATGASTTRAPPRPAGASTGCSPTSLTVGPSARPRPLPHGRRAQGLLPHRLQRQRVAGRRRPAALRTLDGVRVSFFYATRFVVDGAGPTSATSERPRPCGLPRRPRPASPQLRLARVPAPPARALHRAPRRPLDREARRFCNEPRNVRVDAVRRRVVLSKIFDWYADDFAGGAVAFINRYRDRDAQVPGGWRWSSPTTTGGSTAARSGRRALRHIGLRMNATMSRAGRG